MTRKREETEETIDPRGAPRAEVDDRILVLTILWHPDPARVGDRLELGAAEGGIRVARSEPSFTAGAGEGAPLGDRAISRKPFRIARDGAARVVVQRDEHGSELIVQGKALDDVVDRALLDDASLTAGVTMELSGRVVLFLQRRAKPSASGSAVTHGLVGGSEGMEKVRAAIGQVADLDVPVLLLGESGTGKELAAKAIHAASTRAGRAMVAVNVAAVPATTAASELFGHVRGAFTGAARDHEGCFARAHGGTLFLDEIADVPGDVQAMLLRALETGEIQPLGAGAPRPVDVRLVAATDADLDEAVRRGSFRAALLHRLAGFPIRLPALRERREDVGRLLVTFLREELARTGETHRLDPRADAEEPWLGAAAVAKLARHDWPGNVRQLRNVARQIAIASRGETRAKTEDAMRTLGIGDANMTVPAKIRPSVPDAAKRKPASVDGDELLATLRQNEWRIGPTAKALGISKSSLYDRIEKSDAIRKAKDLGREEIEAAVKTEGEGAKLEEVAARLEVSPRGLQLRMRELGMVEE